MPSMRLDRTSGERAHFHPPALSTSSQSPRRPGGALPDTPQAFPLTSHMTPQGHGAHCSPPDSDLFCTSPGCPGDPGPLNPGI